MEEQGPEQLADPIDISSDIGYNDIGMSQLDALTQMLAVTHVVLQALREKTDAYRLTLGEAHLLTLFPDSGEMPLRELQAASGNQASTLGSMVDRLEKRGLARRERSSRDRRAVTVVLEDVGRTVSVLFRNELRIEAERLAEMGVDLAALETITRQILEPGVTHERAGSAA